MRAHVGKSDVRAVDHGTVGRTVTQIARGPGGDVQPGSEMIQTITQLDAARRRQGAQGESHGVVRGRDVRNGPVAV